jgi:hypothetical protein
VRRGIFKRAVDIGDDVGMRGLAGASLPAQARSEAADVRA